MHSIPPPTSIYPPHLPKLPASAPKHLRAAVEVHRTNPNRWNCQRIRREYNARKAREKAKPEAKDKLKAKPKAKAKAKASQKGKSKRTTEETDGAGKRPRKLNGHIGA